MSVLVVRWLLAAHVEQVPIPYKHCSGVQTLAAGGARERSARGAAANTASSLNFPNNQSGSGDAVDSCHRCARARRTGGWRRT